MHTLSEFQAAECENFKILNHVLLVITVVVILGISFNKMELPEIKEEIESYECCGLICRLCLSEESLEDVFKDGFFHEWISDFLSIKVSL